MHHGQNLDKPARLHNAVHQHVAPDHEFPDGARFVQKAPPAFTAAAAGVRIGQTITDFREGFLFDPPP